MQCKICASVFDVFSPILARFMEFFVNFAAKENFKTKQH